MTPAWDWLLFEQLNVFSRAQAAAHHTPSAIAHKLRTGTWRRITHGVMTVGSARLSREQQWWAAVLSAASGAAPPASGTPRSASTTAQPAGAGAVLSAGGTPRGASATGPLASAGAVLAGLAAAQANGLRFASRRRVIDVLVPLERRGQSIVKPLVMDMAVVRVHKTGLLTSVDLQRGRPDRTVTARSIVDAAQWALNDDEARQIIAAACQQKRVDAAVVTTFVTRLERTRRRALILETAAYAADGATTVTEIGFVKLCRKHNLPEPRMQQLRKDSSGKNRYLDAYFADYHLHVEIDGAYHREARQWTDDMLRQNEVWLQGDRVCCASPRI